MRVGILSDTHGLLRPEVFTHLAGVEHILHAGDLGPVDLLLELEALAPVTAVWGNTDGWDVRERCPEVARLDLAGSSIVVVHGQQFGSPSPARVVEAYPAADLVVFGHTHQAVIRQVGSVLVVNPGSAGPKRFRTSPTLALGTLAAGRVTAELVKLA